MRAAIDILMKEHRFIEEVMGSLETFALQLEQGAPASAATVSEYGGFLKNYVDRTHHGKEEDRLFVKMIEHGFPREYGPIAVMLSEHVEGRVHTRVLIEAGQLGGDLSPEAVSRVISSAKGYIPLLRSHIQKEDGILYPMALHNLPVAVLDQLEKDFFAFDSSIMGLETIDRLVQTGKELMELYPPDYQRMAAASVRMGCGHFS